MGTLLPSGIINNASFMGFNQLESLYIASYGLRHTNLCGIKNGTCMIKRFYFECQLVHIAVSAPLGSPKTDPLQLTKYCY